MQHQKVLFAACFVAGLVALASAADDSINPVSCIDKASQATDAFRKAVSKIGTTLTKELTDAALSGAQIDNLTNGFTQLTEQVNSMLDTSGGFSPSALSNSISQIQQTQFSMFGSYLSGGNTMKVFGIYMKATSSLLSAYNEYFTSMGNSCINARRHS